MKALTEFVRVFWKDILIAVPGAILFSYFFWSQNFVAALATFFIIFLLGMLFGTKTDSSGFND